MIKSLKLVLSYVPITYSKVTDKDGSIVISSNDMDVVSTGKNEQEALSNFTSDLVEYAQEFYDEFEFWSSAPNRVKPKWSELRRFCERDGWELYKNTDRTLQNRCQTATHIRFDSAFMFV